MNDQPPPRPTIGKGDTQRPFKGETFRANYDAVFCKKDKQQPTKNDNNGKDIQDLSNLQHR